MVVRTGLRIADIRRRECKGSEDSMTLTKWLAIGRWLRRRTDDFAVVLIATMFICFLLQIAFRYLLNRPLGWTEEVSVLCWVWVVMWGAAFILSDHDEI